LKEKRGSKPGGEKGVEFYQTAELKSRETGICEEGPIWVIKVVLKEGGTEPRRKRFRRQRS